VTTETITQARASRPTIWAISEYYQPNFSGAAIQAHRILSRLVAEKYPVHVLTAADQAALRLAGQERVADGVHIHYLPVARRRDWSHVRWAQAVHDWTGRANNLARDWSFQRQIVRTLRRNAGPGDVLQWYVIGDFTWFTIRLARRRGWRNVIQVSLLGADDPSSFRASLIGVSTALKRNCFNQADRIIGLSRALTDSCRRAGIPPERILRIPNGVDLSLFQPPDRAKSQVRESLGLAANRRYVVFVGSAIRRKGIDVAIKAFIQLASAIPDVDLLVVGPCDFGDLTRHDPSRQQLVDELRRLLAGAGCAERAHWVGEVPNVHEYLQAADVFFFPTRREGLPNAMAEAMASGLPVVARHLPGITTDLADDGVEGRLLDSNDPQDYARVLVELCRQPDLLGKMGRAARQRMAREFDLNLIAPQYAQLYSQLSH
jgi:glycosyltransferase involved in cell wall biosynthesis